MVLSKIDKELEIEKEKQFVYYLRKASDVTGVPLPKIKFWDQYCPDKEFNEIAHIHLEQGNEQICISRYMLRALNLDELKETAIHEFTHLFFAEHDSNFYNKMAEIETAVGLAEFNEKKYRTAAEIIVEQTKQEELTNKKKKKIKEEQKSKKLNKIKPEKINKILTSFVIEINNERKSTKVTLKRLEHNELRKVLCKNSNNEGELKALLLAGMYKVYVEYNKKDIYVKNINVLEEIESQAFLINYKDKNKFDEIPNRKIIEDQFGKETKIGGKTNLMEIQEEDLLEKQRLEKQFKELNPPKKWWQFWK